jgi:hypothetical protein
MRPALEYGRRSLHRGSSQAQDIQPGSIPSVWAQLALRRKALAVAAGAALTMLLSLSVLNGALTVLASTDSAIYALPQAPWIAHILAVFDAHGVRTFYSDSYYDCYNLAFESNERQVCAILGPNGELAPEAWINRYTPYVSAVTSDPHPAYLLPASLAEETDFKLGNLPGRGYLRTVVDGYAIYYYAGATG